MVRHVCGEDSQCAPVRGPEERPRFIEYEHSPLRKRHEVSPFIFYYVDLGKVSERAVQSLEVSAISMSLDAA